MFSSFRNKESKSVSSSTYEFSATTFLEEVYLIVHLILVLHLLKRVGSIFHKNGRYISHFFRFMLFSFVSSIKVLRINCL